MQSAHSNTRSINVVSDILSRRQAYSASGLNQITQGGDQQTHYSIIHATQSVSNNEEHSHSVRSLSLMDFLR